MKLLFDQDMYNPTTRIIETSVWRYVSNEDWPWQVTMESNHTGAVRKFTFVKLTIGEYAIYHNSEMNVRLHIKSNTTDDPNI